MKLEELQKQADAINRKIWKLRDKKDRARNSKLVGKYFKYRNSYSCPESDSDYWFVYYHIKGIEGARLKATKFQTDKYGKIEFDTVNPSWAFLMGFTEITKAEFQKALNQAKKKVNAIK